VVLAGKIDWDWIDGEIAPLYSNQGRSGIATCFVLGLLLLNHIYTLSDEVVADRWVHDPHFPTSVPTSAIRASGSVSFAVENWL
jgi:transposase, IS5 family